MKLCRFELRADLGVVRSGILHEDRLYETDGQNAIGVHELDAIRLLPPLGLPPTLRLFETFQDPDGARGLTYHFANPTRIYGPLSRIPLPDSLGEIDFEVRVATTITEAGSQIEEAEAERFLLGMTILLVLRATDLAEREAARGSAPGPSYDVGFGLGPFLVTPEDLRAQGGADVTRYRWPFRVQVNDEVLGEGDEEAPCSFADMLTLASATGMVLPGELLASPPLLAPSMRRKLDRGLLPGDKVRARVQGLDVLVLDFE